MKPEAIARLLIILLIVSKMAMCQQINILDKTAQPGVVDLTTVTALHPLMSLYDFNRAGFINVEFGLDAKSLHERRQKLTSLDASEKKQLETELEKINTTYSDLKQQQFSLLNEIKQQQNEEKQQKLVVRADELNQQINEIWQKRNLIRFRITNPDLMLPEKTEMTLNRIEKEVLEAVEHVAAENRLTLVLNASVPNHGKRNLQRSFEILTEKNLALAEIDLYYAFLANSSESQEQLKDREHRENGMPARQNGAERWLEQSRQPA
ncbi:MAG: hypothetical protein ACD_39C00297G0004, partial [uncultured bacterium]